MKAKQGENARMKIQHKKWGVVMPQHICDAYNRGSTITELATFNKLPISTVRLGLIRAGVKIRSIKTALSISTFDRASHSRAIGLRPKSNATRKKISEAARLRSKLSAAGVSLKPSGYLAYTKGPHKDRNVHTVTMEQFIGRRLVRGEVVHHKDRNKRNNNISNLELMTSKAHTTLHRAEGW